MNKNLTRIESFINEHHVLSLATIQDETPQCSNLFYAYDTQTQSFIVASEDKTQHIKNVLNNPKVAGTIVLETSSVGKIQGLQFSAQMSKSEDKREYNLYIKCFPYALALSPVLWKIELQTMKLTDNRLGFGKKLLWERKI